MDADTGGEKCSKTCNILLANNPHKNFCCLKKFQNHFFSVIPEVCCNIDKTPKISVERSANEVIEVCDSSTLDSSSPKIICDEIRLSSNQLKDSVGENLITSVGDNLKEIEDPPTDPRIRRNTTFHLKRISWKTYNKNWTDENIEEKVRRRRDYLSPQSAIYRIPSHLRDPRILRKIVKKPKRHSRRSTRRRKRLRPEIVVVHGMHRNKKFHRHSRKHCEKPKILPVPKPESLLGELSIDCSREKNSSMNSPDTKHCESDTEFEHIAMSPFQSPGHVSDSELDITAYPFIISPLRREDHDDEFDKNASSTKIFISKLKESTEVRQKPCGEVAASKLEKSNGVKIKLPAQSVKPTQLTTKEENNKSESITQRFKETQCIQRSRSIFFKKQKTYVMPKSNNPVGKLRIDIEETDNNCMNSRNIKNKESDTKFDYFLQSDHKHEDQLLQVKKKKNVNEAIKSFQKPCPQTSILKLKKSNELQLSTMRQNSELIKFNAKGNCNESDNVTQVIKRNQRIQHPDCKKQKAIPLPKSPVEKLRMNIAKVDSNSTNSCNIKKKKSGAKFDHRITSRLENPNQSVKKINKKETNNKNDISVPMKTLHAQIKNDQNEPNLKSYLKKPLILCISKEDETDTKKQRNDSESRNGTNAHVKMNVNGSNTSSFQACSPTDVRMQESETSSANFTSEWSPKNARSCDIRQKNNKQYIQSTVKERNIVDGGNLQISSSLKNQTSFNNSGENNSTAYKDTVAKDSSAANKTPHLVKANKVLMIETPLEKEDEAHADASNNDAKKKVSNFDVIFNSSEISNLYRKNSCTVPSEGLRSFKNEQNSHSRLNLCRNDGCNKMHPGNKTRKLGIASKKENTNDKATEMFDSTSSNRLVCSKEGQNATSNFSEVLGEKATDLNSTVNDKQLQAPVDKSHSGIHLASDSQVPLFCETGQSCQLSNSLHQTEEENDLTILKCIERRKYFAPKNKSSYTDPTISHRQNLKQSHEPASSQKELSVPLHLEETRMKRQDETTTFPNLPGIVENLKELAEIQRRKSSVYAEYNGTAQSDKSILSGNEKASKSCVNPKDKNETLKLSKISETHGLFPLKNKNDAKDTASPEVVMVAPRDGFSLSRNRNNDGRFEESTQKSDDRNFHVQTFDTTAAIISNKSGEHCKTDQSLYQNRRRSHLNVLNNAELRGNFVPKYYNSITDSAPFAYHDSKSQNVHLTSENKLNKVSCGNLYQNDETRALNYSGNGEQRSKERLGITRKVSSDDGENDIQIVGIVQHDKHRPPEENRNHSVNLHSAGRGKNTSHFSSPDTSTIVTPGHPQSLENEKVAALGLMLLSKQNNASHPVGKTKTLQIQSKKRTGRSRHHQSRDSTVSGGLVSLRKGENIESVPSNNAKRPRLLEFENNRSIDNNYTGNLRVYSKEGPNSASSLNLHSRQGTNFNPVERNEQFMHPGHGYSNDISHPQPPVSSENGQHYVSSLSFRPEEGSHNLYLPNNDEHPYICPRTNGYQIMDTSATQQRDLMLRDGPVPFKNGFSSVSCFHSALPNKHYEKTEEKLRPWENLYSRIGNQNSNIPALPSKVENNTRNTTYFQSPLIKPSCALLSAGQSSNLVPYSKTTSFNSGEATELFLKARCNESGYHQSFGPTLSIVPRAERTHESQMYPIASVNDASASSCLNLYPALNSGHMKQQFVGPVTRVDAGHYQMLGAPPSNESMYSSNGQNMHPQWHHRKEERNTLSHSKFDEIPQHFPPTMNSHIINNPMVTPFNNTAFRMPNPVPLNGLVYPGNTRMNSLQSLQSQSSCLNWPAILAKPNDSPTADNVSFTNGMRPADYWYTPNRQTYVIMNKRTT